MRGQGGIETRDRDEERGAGEWRSGEWGEEVGVKREG